MTPLFFFFLPLLPFLFVLVHRYYLSPKKTKLPPSPPSLPLIGNLHQLSSLPHRSLHRLARLYGPLILVRMGQVPALIVSSAAAAREVLKTHDAAFANRPLSRPALKLAYGARNISFSPYDEYWRQAKKIAVVHLLNSKRVKSFRTVREQAVARMLETISSSSTGVVNLSEVVYEYSNGVVSKAAAGKFEAGKKFRELMEEASVLFGGFQLYDMFPAIGWLSRVTGLDAKLERLAEKWDAFLSGIVAEHVDCTKKKMKRKEEGEKEDEDFVDVLLSLRKEEEEDGIQDLVLQENDVKAIIMDLIAAGTDTSYVALEWAMSELVRHPNILNKAQDEVRGACSEKRSSITDDDLSQMSYLKAIVKEVFRLHPPGPILVPHESTERTLLQGGYEIPAKTRVIINAWAIGRDPESWEDPEEFKPERFLGSSTDFSGNDLRFIPFGAGRRMCPGVNFAICSIELAVANLLHHFDWRLPDGMDAADLDMDEAPGLSTPRKSSLCLVATPHRYA